MSNFDLSLHFVIGAERGYSNHPNDRGGQTNYGITEGTLYNAKKLGIIDSTVATVKNLTLDDAKKIYKEMYWDKINGDNLPGDLSIALFDTAVNMGDKTSVKMLQRILGVTQDGVIGAQTLSAIENYNGNLTNDFLNAREAKYETIAKQPDQGVFLKGWLNRVNALRDYITTHNDSSFLPLWINNSFQTLINALANLCNKLFNDARLAAPPGRRDPLILDLDGDGIETTNVKDGAYFDHDGNGLAEQTGWVAPDDGLLVRDINGNGRIDNGKELFGDQTILKNGSNAANGFAALADLDDNHDGKIDSNDAAFSQLKVWQDIDGDGYSTAGELRSLSEVGITSINVNSTPSSITDPEGNTQTRIGSFEKADGTTGQIANFNLQRDTAYTIAEKWLEVPEDIAALPDLQGFGNVYDLQQAMAREAREVAYA